MNYKDIVQAMNFRILTIVGQKCLSAEMRIRIDIEIEPIFAKEIQETLDARTKKSWPMSLAVWNDPIRATIEKMVDKLKFTEKEIDNVHN